MNFAQRRDFTVFRNDPLQLVFGVIGLDLTGAVMKMAVKLYPDAPGDPLLLLENQATPGQPGLRLVDVTVDDDGVPTSLIEGLRPKADMQALPPSAEFRVPLKLSHDFQWTLPDDGSGLTPQEETVLFGDFIVMGSVNG
jgi:hypothetical protein